MALGIALLAGAAGLATTAPTTKPLPHWHLLLSLALFAGGVLALILAVRLPRRRERGAASDGGPEAGRALEVEASDRPWWLDEVLPNSRDDAFGRGSFVAHAAGLIDDVAGEPSSLVMGLIGPWGSGKSSTLNWILDGIDRDRWQVAHTGAWATGGADGVVLELLRVINATVEVGPEDERHRLVQGIARAASTALVAVAPATEQVPVVGAVLSKVDWKALLPSATEPPLHQQIEALGALASRSPKSTLVVVDDVDRLHPEELLALFRAVRVVGRLPKIHYLLVYDEGTLLRLLSQTAVAGGGASIGGVTPEECRQHAADFLEKIVTLPLVQPPAGREEIEELLRRRLQAAVGQLHSELLPSLEARLDDEVRDFFSKIVDTPRAVVRFAAQLHSYLPLMRVERGDSVDPVDFAVITLLRMRYSTLYDALARDSWALVTRFDGGQEVRARWVSADDLHALSVPATERQSVHQVLRRLFPFGVGVSEDIPEATLRRLQHRDPPRIADADHTPLYFSLVPPARGGDEDLARRAVQELLSGEIGEAWAALTDVVRAGIPPVRTLPDRHESAAARRATLLLRSARALHHNEPIAGDTAALTTLLNLAVQLMTPPHDSRDNQFLNSWILSVAQEMTRIHGPRQLIDAMASGELGTTAAAQRILALGQAYRSTLWLNRLERELIHHPLVEAAWRSALAADLDDIQTPTGKLLQLIDTVAPFQLDALAREKFRSETPISVLDFAARYQRRSQPGATLRNVIRIAGCDQIRNAVQTERIPAGDSVLSAARQGLKRILIADLDEELLLPREVDAVHGAHLPTLPHPLAPLDQSGVGSADLGFTLTATFATPAAQPADDQTPSNWQSWRTAVAALTGESAVTRWLNSAAPSWTGRSEGWSLVSDDPPTHTVARTSIYTGTSGLRTQRPVQFAFELSRNLPGSAASPPGLQVSLEVGIWMDELDRERRPSEGRQRDGLLPAALSEREAVGVLEACWGWIAGAAGAVQPLLSRGEGWAPVRLDVRSAGKPPWEVINLSGSVKQRPGAGARQLTQQLLVRREGVPSLADHVGRLAGQTLHWWLVGQGAEDDGHLPW